MLCSAVSIYHCAAPLGRARRHALEVPVQKGQYVSRKVISRSDYGNTFWARLD